MAANTYCGMLYYVHLFFSKNESCFLFGQEIYRLNNCIRQIETLNCVEGFIYWRHTRHCCDSVVLHKTKITNHC